MEDKQKICNRLCDALKLTRQFNDLVRLSYNVDKNGNEEVQAVFEGGVFKRINVNLDSGYVMILDIMEGLK